MITRPHEGLPDPDRSLPGRVIEIEIDPQNFIHPGISSSWGRATTHGAQLAVDYFSLSIFNLAPGNFAHTLGLTGRIMPL